MSILSLSLGSQVIVRKKEYRSGAVPFISFRNEMAKFEYLRKAVAPSREAQEKPEDEGRLTSR